jgi:hypothetical protein
MPRKNAELGSVFARLQIGLTATIIALGAGAAVPALAASPTEVNLASSAQALAYCQGGSLAKGDTAYFNGYDVQYGDKKCKQGVPVKKVKSALAVNGNTVSQCTLATAKQALKLCNSGGMGEWDIAYIAGPASTVVSGPGYGCSTNTTTLSIGNAVCQ